MHASLEQMRRPIEWLCEHTIPHEPSPGQVRYVQFVHLCFAMPVGSSPSLFPPCGDGVWSMVVVWREERGERREGPLSCCPLLRLCTCMPVCVRVSLTPCSLSIAYMMYHCCIICVSSYPFHIPYRLCVRYHVICHIEFDDLARLHHDRLGEQRVVHGRLCHQPLLRGTVGGLDSLRRGGCGVCRTRVSNGY